MQFAFYMYVVDGYSGVTIMRPGSGTIVYDFFGFVYLANIVLMYVNCCFVHVRW
jgi:hypothetical protein